MQFEITALERGGLSIYSRPSAVISNCIFLSHCFLAWCEWARGQSMRAKTARHRPAIKPFAPSPGSETNRSKAQQHHRPGGRLGNAVGDGPCVNVVDAGISVRKAVAVGRRPAKARHPIG